MIRFLSLLAWPGRLWRTVVSAIKRLRKWPTGPVYPLDDYLDDPW